MPSIRARVPAGQEWGLVHFQGVIDEAARPTTPCRRRGVAAGMPATTVREAIPQPVQAR
jgi:hypothetical protein